MIGSNLSMCLGQAHRQVAANQEAVIRKISSSRNACFVSLAA
jgi:hypothetical protein